jgi:outer membrane murein-binding lipoprotein Lpp
MQNNVIIVIAVIVSLAIGGGGAYAITYNYITAITNEKTELQTQVAHLTSEKNQLQNKITSLTDEKTTLQTQTSTLNAEKTSLQTQVNSLTSENADLDTRYYTLAETIDAMHSSNWTQTINFNITAGKEMNQSFILDKYGIIWETVVDFSGTSLSLRYHYWYKGIRHYVTSFSKSLTTKDNPDITYYGPQDHLSITITIDISIDYRNADRIWVSYATLTQFPEVRTNGSTNIDLNS